MSLSLRVRDMLLLCISMRDKYLRQRRQFIQKNGVVVRGAGSVQPQKLLVDFLVVPVAQPLLRHLFQLVQHCKHRNAAFACVGCWGFAVVMLGVYGLGFRVSEFRVRV